MIKLINLEKSFNNSLVFTNLNYSFEKNSKTLIYGHNGCGKSTLCKILVGILSPSNGEVNGDFSSQKLGWVPSGPEGLFPEMSLLDNLNFYGVLHSLSKNEISNYLDNVRKHFELDFITKRARTCSSGMKQKFNIIRALMLEPTLLIMDEPSVSLDESGVNYLVDELKRINATTIVTSHDEHFVELLGFKKRLWRELSNAA